MTTASTEESVVGALAEGPATVRQLSGRSGVSLTATRMSLYALEKAGLARRESASRQGQPDTWFAAGPAEENAAGVPAGPAPDSPPAAETGTGGAADPDGEALALIQAARQAADEAASALGTSGPGTALDCLDRAAETVRLARRAVRAAGGGRVPGQPGQLREEVRRYMADRPGMDLRPHAVGKALGGRSSGAVTNAMRTLAASSSVTGIREVCAAPFTCRFETAGTAAPDAVAGGK